MRPIARIPHLAVSELLVRYLIYVPPFMRFLNHSMKKPTNRGFLFCDEERVWSPDKLGDALKRQSTLAFGMIINTRQWRHMSIALDRRLCLGIGCKAYGISQDFEKRGLRAEDNEDSSLDGEFDAQDEIGTSTMNQLHMRQAAHISSTNRAAYGNNVDIDCGHDRHPALCVSAGQLFLAR